MCNYLLAYEKKKERDHALSTFFCLKFVCLKNQPV